MKRIRMFYHRVMFELTGRMKPSRCKTFLFGIANSMYDYN